MQLSYWKKRTLYNKGSNCFLLKFGNPCDNCGKGSKSEISQILYKVNATFLSEIKELFVIKDLMVFVKIRKSLHILWQGMRKLKCSCFAKCEFCYNFIYFTPCQTCGKLLWCKNVNYVANCFKYNSKCI